MFKMVILFCGYYCFYGYYGYGCNGYCVYFYEIHRNFELSFCNLYKTSNFGNGKKVENVKNMKKSWEKLNELSGAK